MSKVIVTVEELDRIASVQLAAMVRSMADALDEAGAGHLETGSWCHRFLKHYEAIVEGDEPEEACPPAEKTRGHLRVLAGGES